mmetsp:Transcript_48252/g.160906  ORF Transcript_48252/g.160906 Transcript_48252/m.160906 type:complete len:314 (-) Transcript_48252:684-1625(-)
MPRVFNAPRLLRRCLAAGPERVRQQPEVRVDEDEIGELQLKPDAAPAVERSVESAAEPEDADDGGDGHKRLLALRVRVVDLLPAEPLDGACEEAREPKGNARNSAREADGGRVLFVRRLARAAIVREERLGLGAAEGRRCGEEEEGACTRGLSGGARARLGYARALSGKEETAPTASSFGAQKDEQPSGATRSSPREELIESARASQNRRRRVEKQASAHAEAAWRVRSPPRARQAAYSGSLRPSRRSSSDMTQKWAVSGAVPPIAAPAGKAPRRLLGGACLAGRGHRRWRRRSRGASHLGESRGGVSGSLGE